MPHTYRCGRRRCRRRFHLRKALADYVRPPRGITRSKLCAECGGYLHPTQHKTWNRRFKPNCLCPAYPFPHREGSCAGLMGAVWR